MWGKRCASLMGRRSVSRLSDLACMHVSLSLCSVHPCRSSTSRSHWESHSLSYRKLPPSSHFKPALGVAQALRACLLSFPLSPFELTSGPRQSVLYSAHNLTQCSTEVNLLSWAQISDGYRNVYPYPYMCNPYPQTWQVQ